MVNNPTTSLPACVAMASVLNKPRVVSEFSTPVPNTYEADCAMLMAAYGGFQDIDALYCFQYNGENKNAYTNTNALTDYFDLDENSVKMASARSAALMFRRGDFSPANSTVVVPLELRDRECPAAECMQLGPDQCHLIRRTSANRPDP